MIVIGWVLGVAFIIAAIDHFTGRRLAKLKTWQIFVGLWAIYGVVKLVSMAAGA